VLVVVVGAGLELGIELVPAFRRNMTPIVVDLTLGVLAMVILMATTFIAAIVLTTTGLATGGLTAIGSGVALATIWAAIAVVAMSRLIGTGLARCTSRVLRSTRPARVGVGVRTRDGICQGGPVCGLILMCLKCLEQQDVRVKLIIGHRLNTEGKSRCDGVEFFAEFGDDVVDELVVGERRTGRCHDIVEGLHLLDWSWRRTWRTLA
jgi:hypothetical protein